jgi:PAS domain S-box-containing protein
MARSAKTPLGAAIPLAAACLLCVAWEGPDSGAILCGTVIVALSATVFALAIQLSRQRKAQATLRQSEAMFRSLFEQAAIGAAQLDLEGRFVRVNDKYCSILGRTRAELTQLTFRNVTHPEDLPRDEDMFRRLAQGKVHEDSVQKRYLNKEGKTVWCAASLVGFGHEGSLPDGFILNVQDITALKQAEKQLVQTERLFAVGQLSSGIAHEFNNLLMIILGYIELLKIQQGTIPEVTLACDTISAQVIRGRDIIAQLMVLASPAPSKMEAILLSDLVDQVLDCQDAQLKSEHIQVIRTIREDASVRGDRFHLQQVLINLIVNARHAINPKGKGTITLQSSDEDGRIHLTIEDDGCGMDDETKKKIFTPFFSTKGAFSQNNLGIKGSGLGLAVCLKIIQAHRGEISFSSTSGRGSRFIITLPTAEKAEIAKAHFHMPPVCAISRNEPRFLVVDDEPDLCRVLKEMLAQCGFRDVLTVTSGFEALEQLADHSYDLVFVDLLMPKMSGPDFVQTARKKGIEPHFVFISGQLDIAEDELTILGAEGILYKPFGASQLQKLIRNLFLAKPPTVLTT